MRDALPVQVTVRGRVGPSLRAAFAFLDVDVVPRHHVIVVASGELRDLVRLLLQLERRCIEVDRVATR